MTAIRAFVFNIAFYVITALFLVLGSPLLLGPRKWAMAGLRAHGQACVGLMRLIVGTRVEIRGRERLPPAPALIASKHQSAWDTFGLVPLFRDPAMVMKAELGLIPLYGWFSHKFEHIFVKRDKAAVALKRLVTDGRARASQKRDIVIFPEGTRRAPDAPPDYKSGVVALYEGLQIPCVPVALNTGMFWPRRRFMRLPGTIVVEILEPIPPGLPRKEFKARLETSIEEATRRLVREASASCREPQ